MSQSWLSRIFGGAKPAPSIPAPVTYSADATADVQDYVERLVAAGFMPRDEIIDTALAYAEADGDAQRVEAERATDAALKAHASAQAEWPETTDCDRLDAAFAALEADGIISRQDFTCCGSCGAAEIWDHVQAAEGAGLPARGYAFFHQQDTESAVEGDGLYLNYGSIEESAPAAVAIGHEIVAKLNAHGLQTDWSGSISERIGVSLDWKKRRAAAG